MKPKIILADEPTSALDQFNKNILLDYLLDLKKESSILFVSHDIDSIKKICDSVSVILEGSVVFNEDIQNIKKNRKKSCESWLEEFLNELDKDYEESWCWKELL